MSTPRNVGHFCVAIDPGHFVGQAAYQAAMASYLQAPGARRHGPGRR